MALNARKICYAQPPTMPLPHFYHQFRQKISLYNMDYYIIIFDYHYWIEDDFLFDIYLMLFYYFTDTCI